MCEEPAEFPQPEPGSGLVQFFGLLLAESRPLHGGSTPFFS